MKGAHEARNPKIAGLKTTKAAKAPAEVRNKVGSAAAAFVAAVRAVLATGVPASTTRPVTEVTSFTVESTSTPAVSLRVQCVQLCSQARSCRAARSSQVEALYPCRIAPLVFRVLVMLAIPWLTYCDDKERAGDQHT